MSPQAAMGGGGAILVIAIMVIGRMGGCDPAAVQKVAQQAQNVQQKRAQQQAPAGDGVDDEAKEFISVVLNDTEEVWTDLFRTGVEGGNYRKPKLVMYSGSTPTACGMGQSAMGPFYCPGDQIIYIDPTFFDDLARRHSAPGDFAQAYVIAHEVAHHVQNLTGLNNRANKARASGDERMSNQESVRLELQADYLAGVWANHAHQKFGSLESGDIMEAITAANQIGDDTLQKQAGGSVVPERFTHGTSEQRVRWFRAGLESGDLDGCQQVFEIAYERL